MTTEEPTQPTEPAPRRLLRTRSDRVIAGVCGGIARYLRVDATVVRVVTVASLVIGGLGLILYLAALLVVPEEDSERPAPVNRGGGVAVAAIAALIVLGLIVVPGVGFFAGWIV